MLSPIGFDHVGSDLIESTISGHVRLVPLILGMSEAKRQIGIRARRPERITGARDLEG